MASEETPVEQAAATAAPEATTEAPAQTATPPAEDSVAASQLDGAGPPQKGSALREPEWKVEVKLADLQADPNNPLFSAKSFEELKLCVPRSFHA